MILINRNLNDFMLIIIRGVHGYGSTHEPKQLDPTRSQKFGLDRVIGFVQVKPY